MTSVRRHDTFGKGLQFHVALTDITARRLAETALRRAHDELEQRVSERTAELAKANAQLSRTLARMKQAEAALRKSKEHYLELFKEAQAARRETQWLSSLVIQAQEKERKHISRELHDDVGQTLTAVSITLNGVNRNGDGNAEASRLKLAEAQRLLQGIMATLHDFARELRPSVLDELGLLSAIRSAAHGVEEQTGLRVRLRGDPLAEQLSGEQKLALFRIVQESLGNVVRHTHAKRVKITLARTTAGVVLTVADDGKSFDATQRSSSRRKRLGLLGMQERARLANGKFTIRARPGKGTTVQVLIPVKPSAPSANAGDGRTAKRKIRKNKN
jgi:two-component system, NarL family, sensor histidine kinase UhpB